MEVLKVDNLKVAAAAIQRNGKVLATGYTHAECIAKAYNQIGEMRGFEEGFTLTDGHFVYRDEAFEVAKAANQLKPSFETAVWLSSYMIKEWPE